MSRQEHIKPLQVSRTENKYLLSYEDAVSLQRKLDRLMQRDAFSKDGAYCVRSLYFDSLNNKDLHEKLAGTERRKKVRIRVYGTEDQRCKLEIKYKNGDAQRKAGIWITKQEAQRLTEGDYRVLWERESVSEDLIWLYTQMSLGLYRPTVLIEYDRLAYAHELFDTRITFDMKIRSSEACFDLFAKAPPYFPDLTEKVVLEVKYNGTLLKFISDALKGYHLTRLAISKYRMGRKAYMDYL